MAKVFATLLNKDIEMIQLVGFIPGSLLHLNDSTTHPIPSPMTIGCYKIVTVSHLPHNNENPKGSKPIQNLNFYKWVVDKKKSLKDEHKQGCEITMLYKKERETEFLKEIIKKCLH